MTGIVRHLIAKMEMDSHQCALEIKAASESLPRQYMEEDNTSILRSPPIHSCQCYSKILNTYDSAVGGENDAS